MTGKRAGHLAYPVFPPHVPRMLGWVAAALLAASGILLLLEVDPVPTWFYVFAWYPSLVILDRLGTRNGRPTTLWQRAALPLFAWSPVIWLVFEAADFRLQNWYYVFLPHHGGERWAGILLSFATVVPAVVLGERALHAHGLFRRGRGPVIRVRPVDLWFSGAAGVSMAALALLIPTVFFPLIWGAAVLLADPIVFVRRRELSLIGDVSRGYWGRLGRLLIGGLGIGLLWESYNYWAQAKWIYTVPWLEEIRLFEMPPFGFLGFPVFALEAWSMYAALCAMGVAIAPNGGGGIRPVRTAVAAALAVAFAVWTLTGMESRVISSTTPRLAELPHVTADELTALRSARIDDPFELARRAAGRLAAESGLDEQSARRLVETARLVTLRGIGTRHARTLAELDVSTVCDLARRDPATLYAAVTQRRPGHRPTPAEVRVWTRAAAHRCPP